MPEITVREAVSILSAVSQQLRAAKMLEEALKTALAVEEIVKTKTSEKNVLETQISELHIRLNRLGDEIEETEKRVKVDLAKASNDISVAQEEAVKARAEADKRMERFEEHIREQSKELEDTYIAQKENLEEERKAKEEELASIEAKLQGARNELALMKERLG